MRAALDPTVLGRNQNTRRRIRRSQRPPRPTGPALPAPAPQSRAGTRRPGHPRTHRRRTPPRSTASEAIDAQGYPQRPLRRPVAGGRRERRAWASSNPDSATKRSIASAADALGPSSLEQALARLGKRVVHPHQHAQLRVGQPPPLGRVVAHRLGKWSPGTTRHSSLVRKSADGIPHRRVDPRAAQIDRHASNIDRVQPTAHPGACLQHQALDAGIGQRICDSQAGSPRTDHDHPLDRPRAPVGNRQAAIVILIPGHPQLPISAANQADRLSQTHLLCVRGTVRP